MDTCSLVFSTSRGHTIVAAMAPAPDPASAWLTCGSVSAYTASWRMPRRGTAGGVARGTPPGTVLSAAACAANGVDADEDDATRAAFASARSNVGPRQPSPEKALAVLASASPLIPRVARPLAAPVRRIPPPAPPR